MRHFRLILHWNKLIRISELLESRIMTGSPLFFCGSRWVRYFLSLLSIFLLFYFIVSNFMHCSPITVTRHIVSLLLDPVILCTILICNFRFHFCIRPQTCSCNILYRSIFAFVQTVQAPAECYCGKVDNITKQSIVSTLSYRSSATLLMTFVGF